MFLFFLAYQNHINNQMACLWDDIDAGYVQLQTTQDLFQHLRKAASKSVLNLGQHNWCLILKLYFPQAAISPVMSAAAQNLHQHNLKSILFDCIYGFYMLE